MRKTLLVVVIAALASPLAALATETPTTESQATEGPSPAKACATERASIGATPFKQLHGTNADRSNAFGKCVSKKARARAANHANAAKDCRAEQADPNFAASHDGKTFDQFYGTAKGRNSFGKCVSSKAKAANEAADAATINAAKACKRERASDLAAFKAAYGSRPNAFGKCVSQKAKAQSTP